MTGGTILDTIVVHKERELAARREIVHISEYRARARSLPPTRDFIGALRGNGSARFITEVKKASPSRGVIREGFDPVEIAREYAAAGADALSVLTDKRFFQGHLDFLGRIREQVDLPILRKDFTLDEYHVVEARVAGADAVLLIAAILDSERLTRLREYASELGLAAIVEVHDADELGRALSAGAEIIGVNNRNLKTFETSLDTTFGMRDLVPPDRVLVSESGIESREQVVRLEEAGVDALLIGEALMRADSIAGKIAELRGTDNR